MSDKPTWKEIDSKRDRSSSSSSSDHREKLKPSKVSKGKLDEIFESKKLGDYVKSKEEEKKINSNSDLARITYVRKAMRINDPNKFLIKAKTIITKFDAPPDFEFLERALDLAKISHVIIVLKKIISLLEDDQKPERKKALQARLRMLPIKFQDPDIEDLCKTTLALLK
jgi:hypothetical protein